MNFLIKELGKKKDLNQYKKDLRLFFIENIAYKR